MVTIKITLKYLISFVSVDGAQQRVCGIAALSSAKVGFGGDAMVSIFWQICSFLWKHVRHPCAVEELFERLKQNNALNWVNLHLLWWFDGDMRERG